MAERTLSPLLEGGSFFEGPRWHDGRWWVSDFYRHLVLAIDPDGTVEEVLTVEAQPSGLGWMPDGSLLVVSMKDMKILRRMADGEVVEHADLGALCGGPLNDMVVDATGRAFVGDFGFDFMAGGEVAATTLKRVDPDGTAHVATDDMRFPNGTVITPDGKTLIVGESYGLRYTAFTVGADGTLTDRRVWADLSHRPAIAPDGCALDAEGHIWCADGIGGPCVRIAPGGKIVDEVSPPSRMPIYACMLGGEDGRTLLCCAAPDHMEDQRMNAREAVLFTTTIDVPHAGFP